jgi:predicted metal-dependent hydrolase
MPASAAAESSRTLSQTPFDINVRNDLRWDFSTVDKVFVEGDPLISCLWAALSISAPPIERFFVKALKPTVDTIAGDTKLSADVKCMLAQEVNHAAAHMRFNKQLQNIGYDVKAATIEIERMLEKVTAGLKPIDLLGVVAAGEHGLYSFARAFLRLPAIRNAMHPQAKHLFLYHLLEEAEHGAVSHDQYRYFVGNHYFHRLETAFRVRHTFAMLTNAVTILSGQLEMKITWRNRLALLSYLWIYPGVFRSMVGNLLSYAAPWYRLTFNHEDQADIQKWNDEFYAGQSR